MALLVRRKKIELTEQTIIDRLYLNNHRFCTNYTTLIPNCYTSGDNECDLLAIRKSKFVDEFEVKISRQDFLADAKKCVLVLEEGKKRRKRKPKHEALLNGEMLTNYFWFAVVEGVATVNDLPSPKFGLLIVDEYGYITVANRAKRLSTNKLALEKELYLTRKLAFRFWNYRMNKRD